MCFMRAGPSWRKRKTESLVSRSLRMRDRKRQSYPREVPYYLQGSSARLIRGRQDRASSRKRQSLHLKRLDSRVRKRLTRFRIGPAVQTLVTAWDAIRRVHISPSRDRALDKAPRWRSYKM